jgi:hypothetical protein
MLLSYVEMECEKLDQSVEEACISWVLDGQAFVIRNQTELVEQDPPFSFS